MKLPKHKCSLTIEHNGYKDYYDTIEKAVDERDYEWETPEARIASLNTKEIWTMQWYPDTPIGFYIIAAPTLDDLLRYALVFEEKLKIG